MKRRLLLVVLVLGLLWVPMVCEARNEEVTVSSASVTSAGATISGTTNAPAVMVQIRDASNEIVVMASFAVKDNEFSGSITQSLTAGANYTIFVADYEGGAFATEEVTATSAPGPAPSSSGSGGSSSGGSTTVTSTVTDTNTVNEQPETVTVREERSYTVVKGDTLSKIARKLQVSLKDLREWNNIKNINRIYTGQQIIYYVTVTKTTGQVTGNDPVPTEDTAGVYVVEKGDTLSKIARKLKLTLKQILSKNTIKNVNRIYPGQKIKY